MESVVCNRNILVTGASGFVGSEFMRQLSKDYSDELYGTFHSNSAPFDSKKMLKVDIADAFEVEKLFPLNLGLIVHCAALTGIENCEKQADLAHCVNVQGTRHLASLAYKSRATLIYLSTDTVFDGNRGEYIETDGTSPLHCYGRTKLLGEQSCFSSLAKPLIIRTNTFGFSSGGFLHSLLENVSKGKEYRAFTDALFCPLYVTDLVRIVLQLAKKGAHGIYHVVGPEALSKFHFAQLLVGKLGYDTSLVKPASVMSTSIPRERNLHLQTFKLMDELGKEALPSLEEMIEAFCSSLRENSKSTRRSLARDIKL